jgi:glycosyltransferase involved in cell wall biosynthesis
MDRERYPSHVLVWSYSPDDFYVEEIRSLGIPTHRFPPGASRIAKMCGVRRLAQSLAAEVIHSWSFYTNFPAYFAAVKTKAVALGFVQGEFANEKKNSGPLLARLGARWPRYQISNNLHAAAEMHSAGTTWSPAHIRMVRNGIDLERFAFSNWSACSSSTPSIVGVGSLLPLKRWDRILRIVREVRARGIDCRLTIAGEGPERATLEQQSQELRLERHVELIGATSDVPELLKQSRLLVHASETEGCPNAVLEAMACGRPVVAMEAGDVPLLVEDGRTGYVIRQGDEETFGQRVIQLLSNEDLCRRMGLAAREKAEREFGVERLVMETLAAYRAAGWEG